MMMIDDQQIHIDVMPRVLVISLPKSGTNVLESTLAEFAGMSEARRLGLNNRMRLHPFNWIPFFGQEECLMGVTRPVKVKLSAVKSSLKRISPGKYALGHIPYQKNVHELIHQFAIRPIFVIRDPRDVLISFVHYALSRKNHFLHQTMVKMKDSKQRIMAMITGGTTLDGHPYLSIADQLDRMFGWYESGDVLTVRFEAIIGPKGQGTIKEQTEIITQIGNFIGIQVNQSKAEMIGEAMFGKGRTFRKGAIGGWQDVFDDEINTLLNQHAGAMLEKFGYL